MSGMVLIPAPVRGWDAAYSRVRMEPDRGIMLRNFFPQPDYVEIRKGRRAHRNTGTGKPVESLMPWHGPAGSKLFAASGKAIAEVTGFDAVGIPTPDITGMTNDRWQSINFNTSGGNYLWICNGADTPRYYDGSAWTAATITGIATPSKVINVSSHKGRIWMTQKDSTIAAYLPVGSLQGAAVTFDMQGIFTKGGYLVATSSWSIDGGDGPDDLMVFISSNGQAAIYKGTDPAAAETWAIVGVYDIGEPIGRRCFRQFGTDLAVVTTSGVLPLSEAMVSDEMQNDRISVARNIQREFNHAARNWSSQFGWEAISYPRGTMAIINVPQVAGEEQKQFVMNTISGAWCEFTGWNANTFAVFDRRLFYGGNDGVVYEADLPGADSGASFDAYIRTAWSDYGQGAQIKRWMMVQPQIESNLLIRPTVGVLLDYDAPKVDGADSSIYPGPEQALWDSALWDESLWAQENIVQREWYGLGGVGRSASIEFGVNIQAPSLESGDETDDQFSFHLRVLGFQVLSEAGGFM